MVSAQALGIGECDVSRCGGPLYAGAALRRRAKVVVVMATKRVTLKIRMMMERAFQ
jgi:hypothetical protein